MSPLARAKSALRPWNSDQSAYPPTERTVINKPTPTEIRQFSEKNADDDKLITLEYTVKLLTNEEHRAIYEGLKGQPAGPAFNADVGVELPYSTELRAVPNEVAARVPQTKDYRYAVADNRVLARWFLYRTPGALPWDTAGRPHPRDPGRAVPTAALVRVDGPSMVR